MKKFTTILLSLFLVTTIAGCGNPAGTGSNTTNGGTNSGSSGNSWSGTYCGQVFTIPQPALPDSIGENPFVGKTLTAQFTGGGTSGATLTFASNTCTNSYSNGPKQITDSYRYSYNANNNLLYLSLTATTASDSTGNPSNNYNINSFSDFVDQFNLGYPNLSSYTDERKIYLMDWTIKTVFYPIIYQYSISGNTVTVSRYFGGTLPIDCSFQYNNSPQSISLSRSSLSLTNGTNHLDCSNCTFNNGTISGKLFTSQSSGPLTVLEGDILGDFTATYTTSGTGTSGCSVTITFTSLPASVQSFTTNTPYTLTQQ